MYTSQELATAIKMTAKKSNKVLKEVFLNCGINSNTMSALYHNKSIAFDSLAKISDELNCSVDYLLGRSDNPLSHKSISVTVGDISDSQNSVIGNNNSDISIYGEKSLSSKEETLLEYFNKLDEKEKTKALFFVIDLAKEK